MKKPVVQRCQLSSSSRSGSRFPAGHGPVWVGPLTAGGSGSSCANSFDKGVVEFWGQQWRPQAGLGLWSADKIISHARSPQVKTFGAGVCAEKPGALLLARQGPDALDVDFLGTLPGFRRLGLMAALFQWVLIKARPSSIWLEVHEKNQGAQAFYRKMGGALVGKRPNYYTDGGAALLFSWEP